MEGEPQRIALWVQVLTGMELDRDNVVHVLDARSWRERRERLDALGGPPDAATTVQNNGFFR
ncbi:MAG: hypothetical protein L0Z62_08225 [Gemmataceae bacterium]|nr:hypothetical protein [Gemmataceae bacterium]